MSDLLKDLEPMPDETVVFSSSGATFLVETDEGIAGLKFTGILIFIICILGFLNGLDFASPKSGIVRPDEFIYAFAKSAPPGSSELSGVITHNGQPVEGIEVHISMLDENGLWVGVWNYTDNNGQYKLVDLNPGLSMLSITRMTENNTDIFRNRILLTPPSFFESKGYTNLDLSFPNDSEFEKLNCENNQSTCIREIPHPPEQMAHPLIDSSAAITYVMIGGGFIGLSVIAAGFTLVGLRTQSRGLLRTAAGLAFFTQGHFYSACMLSLFAIFLTFLIPKKYVELES